MSLYNTYSSLLELDSDLQEKRYGCCKIGFVIHYKFFLPFSEYLFRSGKVMIQFMLVTKN